MRLGLVDHIDCPDLNFLSENALFLPHDTMGTVTEYLLKSPMLFIATSPLAHDLSGLMIDVHREAIAELGLESSVSDEL